MTLVAFKWFRQINILPNPLFQQITKYYIRQYLFLYGNTKNLFKPTLFLYNHSPLLRILHLTH